MTMVLEESNKPILCLTTAEPVSQHITIDGQPYELAALGDLLVGHLRLQRWSRLYLAAIEPLDKGEEVGDEDAEALRKATDSLCRGILRDCPDEVFNRLTDEHKLSLIVAFIESSGFLARPTA